MGARFRNVYFFIFIFILDISCQHLGNTCQLNLYTGFGYILPTIEDICQIGGFLPQGPTVQGPIVYPEKVDSWAPGPNCPGPNCPGPNCPGPNCPGPNCPGPNLPRTALRFSCVIFSRLQLSTQMGPPEPMENLVTNSQTLTGHKMSF